MLTSSACLIFVALCSIPILWVGVMIILQLLLAKTFFIQKEEGSYTVLTNKYVSFHSASE